MNYEDRQKELMMLLTDMALQTDPRFSSWAKKYEDDKDVVFGYLTAVFAKLLEPDIQRDD